MWNIQPISMKSLQIRVHGFGMPTLEILDFAMTLICSTEDHCLQNTQWRVAKGGVWGKWVQVHQGILPCGCDIPTLATFIKPIPNPQGNKKIHFYSAQDAARKDVESIWDFARPFYYCVVWLSFGTKTLWRIIINSCDLVKYGHPVWVWPKFWPPL
jgi:hypothetical protein